MNRKFPAQIIDGRLVMDDRGKFEQYLHNDISGRVEVIVRNPKNKRSIPQNKYYWGVVVDRISEETGESKDEIHEFLKFKFLREVAEFKGEKYAFVRSTADLSTTEWEDYMSDCRQWASQNLGLFIPKPNEFAYI